jgi:hypothetical protein
MIAKIAKQLSLWGSKRQRGVKAPPPLEFNVHVAIADTLRRWVSPGWLWMHVPNGEERPSKIDAKGRRYSPAADRLKRMGARDGVADFILIGPPTATVFAYELKRQGKRPTETQMQFGAEIIAAGGYWAWGDTYDHAIATFQEWGALPRTIHPQ